MKTYPPTPPLGSEWVRGPSGHRANPTAEQGDGPTPRRFPGVLAASILALMLPACAPDLIPGGTPHPTEIPALDAHVRANPDDRDARTRLGAAYLELDRPDRARPVLEQAAEDPAHPMALFLLGTALEEEDAWGEARDAYERYLEREPDGAVAEEVEGRLALIRRKELEAEVRETLAREGELADTPPQSGTVAVFPFHFDGTNEELEPLSRAMAEMVVTDLGQVDRLRVLERLQVQLLLDEMALSEEERVEPGTAARSGHLLGAGEVVQGRLGGSNEELDVLAAVVATERAEEIESINEADALEAFFELHERVVLGLFESLGVRLTESERDRVLERPTESLEALLLYGRALEAEDRGDFAEAAVLYQEAAEADPEFQEAEERRTGAERMEEHQARPAEGFRQDAGDLMPPGVEPGPTPGELQRALGGTPEILPAPEERDPGADVLNTEGLLLAPATLELILRPR